MEKVFVASDVETSVMDYRSFLTSMHDFAGNLVCPFKMGERNK